MPEGHTISDTRLAFSVRADQLRAGRNRLAVTAVDADGRRARRALVVLRA
jgi:hypothetical protein